jgi:hypothetical protein
MFMILQGRTPPVREPKTLSLVNKKPFLRSSILPPLALAQGGCASKVLPISANTLSKKLAPSLPSHPSR